MVERFCWTGVGSACLFLVFSALLAGCAPMLSSVGGSPGPEIRDSGGIYGAVERPPSDPEDVEVYYVEEGGELEVPEGVAFQDDGNFTHMFKLEDNFPTADDPHAWVGQYTMSRSDEFEVEEVKDALRKRAAEDGATAVFIRSYGNNARARGAYISDAEPPAVATRPASEMIDEVSQKIIEEQGYEEVLLTEERELSEVEPLVFDVERGDCLWVVFALEEDASFSAAARQGFQMNRSTPNSTEPRSLTPNIEPRDDSRNLTREARAGRTHLSCSSSDTEYSVRFLRGAMDNRSYDMGEGTMVLKVFRKQLSEEEVVERQERREERAQEAREEGEERNREICRECHDELYNCPADTRGDCQPYRQCIQRNYGDVDLCVEGGR